MHALSHDFWVYDLGAELGPHAISMSELVANHGPVRPGFEDRTGFTTLFTAGKESALELATKLLRPILQTLTESLSISTVIFVGSSSEFRTPGNASLLQQELNLKKEILTLDINDACTGFIKSLYVASRIIENSHTPNVLLVIADTYRKYFEESNMKVSPLFSDAASAFLISKLRIPELRNRVTERNWAIEGVSFMSDGGKSDTLKITSSEIGNDELFMDGAEVFKFVLGNLGSVVEKASADAQEIQRHDVEWVVHQGSRAVVNAVESILGKPEDSLFKSAQYGNTVGSSLPIQLKEISPFDEKTIGLLAFGVGLSMGCLFVRQGSLPE